MCQGPERLTLSIQAIFFLYKCGSSEFTKRHTTSVLRSMSLLNCNYWVPCLISHIQGVTLGEAKDKSRIFSFFPHLCLHLPAHDSQPQYAMLEYNNFLKCIWMVEEPTEDTAVYLLQNSFNLWGILSIRRGIEQDKRRKQLVLCFNKPFQSLHCECGPFWLTVDQSIKISHHLTSVVRHEKQRL